MHQTTNMWAGKFFKRIFILSFVFVITAFLFLTIIFKYRIKSVLKEVVNRETRGAYQIDFSRISVSLVKGRVMVNETELKPTNTPKYKEYFQLKISSLYFSLGSWQQLLFHGILFVDSLQINQPDISIFHSSSHSNTNTAVQIRKIYASLKDISEKYKIHVLEIKKANVGIHSLEANTTSLVMGNIDFRLENFGQKKNQKSKLRYSDNIVLNIPQQRWVFASGQSFSFKNLFFSGKDQFFEIDSCTLAVPTASSGNTSSLYADKLLIMAELSSIFEKDELKIDTLNCKSPILSLNLHSTAEDSADDLHQLFGNIHIQYLNIENGQIQLKSSDGNRSYTSQKSNLKIYALDISHDLFPHIHVGNIDFHLNNVSFASRDSLYQLTIKEFKLDGNNLVCKNAFLKPSPKNVGIFSGMNLPAFTLINVSLQDLLEKRLKAQSVLIDKPQVHFIVEGGNKKPIKEGISVDRFYDALSGLAQIIDVHRLTVKGGDLESHSILNKAFKLAIKNINAEINLEDLLASSSPVTTKQSIRMMSMGSLILNDENITAELKNFFINGTMQTGKLGSLDLYLSPGIRLHSDNTSWERLSWEDFIKNKRINIDSLNIGKLYLTIASGQHDQKNKKKSILSIAIKKLDTHEAFIELNKRKNNVQLRAKASDIILTQLTLLDSVLLWADVVAKFENISFHDDHKHITAQQLKLSGNNESNAENITYDDSINSVRIPKIKFWLSINKPILRDFNFQYLSIYKPEIMIRKPFSDFEVNKKNTTTGITPFHIQKLDITDGHFNYRYPDKISTSAYFNAKIESARTDDNNTAISFSQGTLNFDSVTISTEKFYAALNKLNLDVSEGVWSSNYTQEPVFKGLVNGQWSSMMLIKPMKNSSVEIGDLSGGVQNLSLTIESRNNNQLVDDIIDRMSLTTGRLCYTNSAVTGMISGISGSGKNGTLVLKNIEVRPNTTLGLFLKTSRWQKSYQTFNCERVLLKRINTKALLHDSGIVIQHIYFQSPHLSTFRDKNIAFQHGMEKFMPSKLIAGIKIPVQIDSVSIKEGSVDVREISAVTKREAVIPVRNINALLTNIKSQPDQKDSLLIEASANVVDYTVPKLLYSESYADSLSGFKMSYNFSPMFLPTLTKVTNPLSAVAVTSGHADTLYTSLSGNKYAAFGEINFYYDKLRIRFLNREDTTKKNFRLAFKTRFVNSIIVKSSNKKQSNIFFIRDREKFVFNYWLKTLFSGFLTSTGIKSNGKYKKMHDHLKEKYSLPGMEY